MKHILVSIGAAEEQAKSTLQYAVDFAKEINAKIIAFKGYNNIPTRAGTMLNVDRILEDEANLDLRTLTDTVDKKGVSIRVISAKGNIIDNINAIDNEVGIDLVMVDSESKSIKEELFLGKIAGSLVKKMDLPLLIIPKNYTNSPIKNILMAFKSGVIKYRYALKPLKFIVEEFKARVHLLLVKTPNYTEKDLVIDKDLMALEYSLTTSENVTTYQGVLEHIQTHNPDMLCVFRRRRGFFKKLWERDTILKKEFFASVPLLVLKGGEYN